VSSSAESSVSSSVSSLHVTAALNLAEKRQNLVMQQKKQNLAI